MEIIGIKDICVMPDEGKDSPGFISFTTISGDMIHMSPKNNHVYHVNMYADKYGVWTVDIDIVQVLVEKEQS